MLKLRLKTFPNYLESASGFSTQQFRVVY